ncbi:MAG: heme ABC transporter permease, partial [Gammaproteobacteria bacterium]|nr:heme ABC transporter permease [Gammaproteobacteria bacterium]
NTLHQGSSIDVNQAPKMASIMLWTMLIMSLAAWLYSIAIALYRVRVIILERERHSDWVRALVGARP